MPLCRVVVITGASRGLGLCLAEKFLDRGDLVFGVSKAERHWNGLERHMRHRDRFVLDQVDVTLETSVRSFLSKVLRKTNRIDILINNAGYGGRLQRVEDTPAREVRKHVTQNFFSQFLMCKYTIPIFRRQKQGFIINVASMAGKRAVPRLAAYSASKFSVVALSQSIAKENQDVNLKCVTVCPGGMNTDMRKSLFGVADAESQQSPRFVADVIMDIIDGRVEVETGGDVVIRHGVLEAIHFNPDA